MVAYDAPQPTKRKSSNTITVTAPKGATKVKVAAKFKEPDDGKDDQDGKAKRRRPQKTAR